METRHRQRIDLLCDLIVRQVDMKALWLYLFMKGILNFNEYNVPNWSQDTTNPKMMTQSFHKFQKVIATGNIAIITENEAALKQIKLIQELYDLFEDKCEDSIGKKTKL